MRFVGEGLAPPVSRSRIGPYKKNAVVPVSAVGAGALTRPPFSTAQLEPHRNKGAFQKGSAQPVYTGRRRRPPTQSPTKWVCVGEEEQGSGRSFRREAETETSGLCDDEAAAEGEVQCVA